MPARDPKDESVKTPPTAGDAETMVGPTPLETALAQRYEIQAELGRGGMGIVYRARDRETNEVVALKVLKPEIARQADLIGRFKTELRLARRVTHKNVWRIYELLRFGESVAITMEFVEGESLRSILARYGGVPLRRGLEWAQQICEALSEAHAQGIVHRDLKPENILIDRDSQAKIMDFGIARSLEGEATQTAAGVVVGTPAYMSPEQAEGKPVDPRADIYALGLIFYEMFTGRPAFKADSGFALALKQIHETPPPPRAVEPCLPAAVEEAILRCIEKDPAKRYGSVGELKVALMRKIEAPASAPQAAPEPLPDLVPGWLRNRDALLILSFLVILSVLLANMVLARYGFIVAIGVILNVVLTLVAWPRLRRFRPLFCVGISMGVAAWLIASYVVWSVEPVLIPLLMKSGSLGAVTRTIEMTKLILGVTNFLPWAIFGVVFAPAYMLQPGAQVLGKWQRLERACTLWLLCFYDSVPFGILLIVLSTFFIWWVIHGCLIDPLARLGAH